MATDCTASPPRASPMAAVRVCERNCILAEWEEREDDGEAPWISVDKCRGTETGFETRERTVTPVNLCLMIIAYPQPVEIPMEFSLPRSLKISKPHRIEESPSRWLIWWKSFYLIDPNYSQKLCTILITIYYRVCYEIFFFSLTVYYKKI